MRARRARRSVPAVLAMVLLAAAGACRDSGGDDTVDPIDAGDGDATNPDDMKIQHVQDDATAVGTAVTLRGVVVVSKDTYGNRSGNFHVMEPEGGAYSGVLVFGAPLEQFDAIAVGDLVDITNAEKDEFGHEDDTTTFTELIGAGGGDMVVTKVGTGTVPAPHVLDALAIGRMGEAMARDEYEKWEHVLVRVENVSVGRAIRCIGMACSDPTFKDFGVTGYLLIDSSLAEIPDMLVAPGDCLASVSGVMDYFFDYKILPRATADIVTGGTSCPAPENTAELCGDGIDNDANGFADCMDNSCRVVPSCTANTTVAMIQNGTVPDGSQVTLSNVVVTGRSFNGRHIWVADSLQAAQYNGIYVFRTSGAGTLPDNIVVGAVVDVVGTVDEFGTGGETVTEITFPTITLVSAPAAPTVPVTVPAATLRAPATGEPYEGVLVRITGARLTAVGAAPNHLRTLTIGATTITADDDIYRIPNAVGTCFQSMVGIWHYNTFADVQSSVFLPRSEAELVVDATGGACP